MAGGVVSNLTYAVGFKIATSALKKSEKQVEGLSKKMKGFGVAAGVVGAAIVGIGAASVGMAVDYEKSMSNIQMATGATSEQMETTRGIAENLYNQNFGESWADLGGAISSVQQITQETGEALEETTRHALLLRDAFGIEVNESARAAKTMIENFGISSEEAFNLIAQGSQKGLDFSGELIDTINEYSLQFKSLGFDADEMFDTLAAGSAEGAFNLDKVADAVKEFGIRSKDAGDKGAIEAFEMLGLNAEKMMSTFAAGGPEAKKSFTQIIQMISDIDDPVQQNSVAVGLFGTQFEDLQKDVITAMGTVDSQFDMTIGTMDQLNQTKIETPGQALELIGRQLETGLLIPLGQLLIPLLEGASKVIGFFIEHFDILGPAIGTVAAILFGAAVPAMWAAASAGWLMMAPFLPIIAVALAVGAAIAGIILIFKKWGNIGPWLSQKWTQFKNWTIGVFNSIVEFFKSWGGTLLLVLSGPIGITIALVIKYWDQIKAFTVNIFNGIASFLSGLWTSIVTSISNSLTNIWTNITDIWNRVTTFLKDINLFDIGKNIIEGMVNGISSMATAVVDKVKAIGDSITDKIKGILGIHSPSRVMMELGFYTGEGLAQGIEGTQSRVEDASSDVAGGAEAAAVSSVGQNTLAPARSAASGRSANVEIHIPITIQGNADASTVSDLRDAIHNEVHEIISSTIRRMGLEVGLVGVD